MAGIAKELGGFTPQQAAESLAFGANYSQATVRLESFVGSRGYYDWSGKSLKLIGENVVWAIEVEYDPDNENTLQKTAALIAKYSGFLAEHGLNDDRAQAEMLLTAADIEVARSRRNKREHRGDQYYQAQLLEFRNIRQGVYNIVQKVSPRSPSI